ncbi:hypothetical protein, partial [Arenibacter aquaticus]|uniref:hypothetical protein n=1 Tax=Arenibacter aquaticus TaxID=2489054 RepID=UPI001304ACB3
ILKGDMGVVPKLKEIAMDNESFWTDNFGDRDYPIERIYELWTFRGTWVFNKELKLEKLKDVDPMVHENEVKDNRAKNTERKSY